MEVDDPSNQRSGLSSFEDARLDEPESLFERITNQLMDIKAPIIIINTLGRNSLIHGYRGSAK